MTVPIVITAGAIWNALESMGVPANTITKFMRWHSANPQVWKAFEAATLTAIYAGEQHYGAKAIAELIRWKMRIVNKNKGWKLNNDFPAYYARVFATKYPHHRKFFKQRKIRGLKKAA